MYGNDVDTAFFSYTPEGQNDALTIFETAAAARCTPAQAPLRPPLDTRRGFRLHYARPCMRSYVCAT